MKAGTKYTSWSRNLIFAATTAFLLTGCDRFPGEQAAAARLADTDGVEVVFAACPQETVSGVDVYRTSGKVIGDADDDLIWAITSGGVRLTGFVIGVVPDGFEERVTFSDAMGAGDTIGVLIDADGESPVISFTMDDLRLDDLYTRTGEYQSEADFIDEQGGRCE